ncbi:MAG: hypothetical protein AB1567_02490 [bacterium]
MFKKIWHAWKDVAHKTGNFQARIILSIFYFIMVAPIAIGVKLFSNPLGLKRRANSYWIPKVFKKYDLKNARRQF